MGASPAVHLPRSASIWLQLYYYVANVCFSSLESWNSSRVLVGPYKRDSTQGPAQWRKIKSKLLFHPKWDAESSNFDLLMFKIEAITKKNLKPIKLNKSKSVPGDNETLTAIGMGVDESGSVSNVLRKVKITTVSHAACKAAWAPNDIVKRTTVCATTTGCKSVFGGMPVASVMIRRYLC